MLALESYHRGINAPLLRSPIVDGERIEPSHWLGAVISVSFSPLTLLVG